MASKIFGFVVGVIQMALRADDHLPAKRYSLREVETYEVQRSDFDRIEHESGSIGTHLQLFFFWLPIALMLAVTLSTVPIQNFNLKDLYQCLMFVGFGLTLFHGAFAFRQRGQFKRLMDGIRERQVPPLGEKGSELGPSEVSQLPSGPTGPAGPTGPESSTPRGAQ